MKGSIHRHLKFLLPQFLLVDYSPYKCKVSANRENYDLRARRIHIQNKLKTWINTNKNPFIRPVECKACLFDTRIPNIYIGPDGLCNMCMTYRQNFSPDVLASELQTFLDTPRESGAKYDAVVAFSGGKDSTASLYLARTRFKLDVVAVLVDNDFIPSEVIEKGRDFCRAMGVPLVILHIDFAPHVKRLMERNFKSGYPCYMCTTMFHQKIKEYCAENRINRVILGRNWWRWLEPEVRAVRWVRDEEAGLDIQLLSLPFALRLTESSVKTILSEVGWRPVDLYGNSTNCLIPGYVEASLQKRIGYHPELNLLSREVISGYLEKEEAKRKLEQVEDLTPLLEQTVNRILETRVANRDAEAQR